MTNIKEFNKLKGLKHLYSLLVIFTFIFLGGCTSIVFYNITNDFSNVVLIYSLGLVLSFIALTYTGKQIDKLEKDKENKDNGKKNKIKEVIKNIN